jgi:hypothetical protein
VPPYLHGRILWWEVVPSEAPRESVSGTGGAKVNQLHNAVCHHNVLQLEVLVDDSLADRAPLAASAPCLKTE